MDKIDEKLVMRLSLATLIFLNTFLPTQIKESKAISNIIYEGFNKTCYQIKKNYQKCEPYLNQISSAAKFAGGAATGLASLEPPYF